MSPEQKRAMAAVKEGNAVPETIDGRSDIYSLGLLLYESLGGELAAENHGLFPALRRRNPQVSVGLSDIIARCLAARPERRYQDAGTLATDLWAHLNDMPLKGVGNRSPIERLRKLRRRKPHLYSLVVMSAAAVLLAVAAIVIASVHFSHKVGEARAALADGQKLVKAARHAEGIVALKRGLAQLESVPGNQTLKRQLLDRLRWATRAQASHGLHEIADRFRFLYGVDSFSSAKLETLETRCRNFWDNRVMILDRLGKELEPEAEQRLQLDLLDLAVLGADLRVRLAGKDQAGPARKAALQTLDQAEALFGPNAVLYHERRLHAAALGLGDMARAAERRGSECPPRTAWENYALGRSFLNAGKVDAAAERLKRALALEPGGLWPSFYHGVCCYRLCKFDESALSFTTCVALAPNVAGCFYNRGLAFAGWKKADLAVADFSRALELEPAFAEAAFNRGLVRLEQNLLSDAAADFRRARDAGHTAAADLLKRIAK
jgi:tetratricopeptide (TPR) repeat protein